MSLDDSGAADFNLECEKGDSSLLTLRVRLEKVMPFVASTAREIAAQSGLEVGYRWLLGGETRYYKISPAGRVAPISKHSTDRFKAFIHSL